MLSSNWDGLSLMRSEMYTITMQNWYVQVRGMDSLYIDLLPSLLQLGRGVTA